MRPDLVFIGVVLIFIGIILLTLSPALSSANIQYGGVILIGPIPILFGSSNVAFFGLILALTIILALLFVRW